MSIFGDIGSYLKSIVLLSDKVERQSEDLLSIADDVEDHEKRLIRIETMIEMAQRGSGNLRLDD